MRWSWPLTVSAVLVTAMPSARAQPAAELYDDGLKAMLDGDFDRGCPLLERSVQAEPLAGAVFTLAECYAKWGRHASAIAEYRRYLSMFVAMSPAKRDAQKGRDSLARDQVGALEAIVPRITVTAPGVPEGSRYALDGRPVSPDEAEMVNAGTHRAEVTLPDGEVLTASADVAAGESTTLTVTRDVAPATPAAVTDESSSDMPWTTLGWVAIGLGGGGLVAGAITGGLALGKKGTIEDNCVQERCNLDGLDAASNAQSLATVSTALFVLGGVLESAGVVTVILAPGDDEAASARVGVELGPTGGSLRVSW